MSVRKISLGNVDQTDDQIHNQQTDSFYTTHRTSPKLQIN